MNKKIDQKFQKFENFEVSKWVTIVYSIEPLSKGRHESVSISSFELTDPTINHFISIILDGKQPNIIEAIINSKMLVKCQTLSVHDVGNLAIGDSNFYDLTIGDFDSTMLATLQTFSPHTSDFYQLLFIINIDLSLQPL